MAGLENLITEVNQILNAPCIVSITHLQNIIRSLEDPSETLRRWVHIKECQIPKLSEYLFETMDLKSGLFPLVDFLKVEGFTDTVLRKRPDLLAGWVEQCQGDSWNDPTLIAACLELLKTPGVKLPQHLSGFLDVLFGSQPHKPQALDIENVERLLTKLSREILEVLSERAIQHLIATCRTVFNNSKDHANNLRCVSMAAAVYKVTSECSSSLDSLRSSPNYSVISEWASKMATYFTGAKASNNLYMTVVRVIFCCSPNEKVPSAKAVELIDIANKLLETIDRRKICEWAFANPHIVDKLWRSACREDLDAEVKFSVFAVCMQVNREGAHHEQIAALISSLIVVLTAEANVKPLYTQLSAVEKTSTVTNALQPLLASKIAFCTQAIGQIVQFIFNQCRPGRSANLQDVFKTENALLLVRAMTTSFRISPTLSRIVLNAIDVAEFPEWWTIDLVPVQDMDWGNCGNMNICPRSFEELRIDLTVQFSVLLLEVTCTNQEALSQEIFQILQKRIVRGRLTPPATQCRYPPVRRAARPQLEVKIAGQQHPAGVDWFQKLRDDLAKMNGTAEDLILRYVQDAVSDLEHRCETVEQPLRAANTRAASLRDALDSTNDFLQAEKGRTKSLEVAVAELELNISNQAKIIETLNVAVEELQKRDDQNIRLLNDRNTAILRNEEGYRAQLEIVRLSAMQRESARTIENKAAIVALEEQLTEETERSTKLQGEVQWLVEQSDLMRQELEECHKSELAQLQREKAHVEVAARAEIDRLQAIVSDEEQKAAQLQATLAANHGKLCQNADVIRNYSTREKAWNLERARFEKDLTAAKTRENRVLAAIRGKSSGRVMSTASQESTVDGSQFESQKNQVVVSEDDEDYSRFISKLG